MKKLLIVLPLFLAACGNSSTGKPVAAQSANVPKLELNSPDQAVKTWWKVRDSIQIERDNNCERNKEVEKSAAVAAVKDVTTGLALQSGEFDSLCVHPRFGREIVEVKVESETRAVVLAKIKATTPIPAGATPDEQDLKRRAEGDLYKYVLEKVGKDWKIAQIYSHQSYGGDPWSPEYKEPKPYVHAFIFGPQ
jgi:hypothetical protein